MLTGFYVDIVGIFLGYREPELVGDHDPYLFAYGASNASRRGLVARLKNRLESAGL